MCIRDREVFADEVLAVEQQGVSQVAHQRAYKVQRSLFSIVTALVRDQAGKEADEELIEQRNGSFRNIERVGEVIEERAKAAGHTAIDRPEQDTGQGTERCV